MKQDKKRLLDPRSASRTPSANKEPVQPPRFTSPFNACECFASNFYVTCECSSSCFSYISVNRYYICSSKLIFIHIYNVNTCRYCI